MRYGITINLDYESFPYEATYGVFRSIRDALLAEGFRQDGRVFTIDCPEREAVGLARQILDRLDQRIDGGVFRFVKEFYGFDVAGAVNLLVPADAGAIDVDEVGEEDLANLWRDYSAEG